MERQRTVERHRMMRYFGKRGEAKTQENVQDRVQRMVESS
jgi:hypothetical protein